jgi:hypothetical protein
MLDGDEIIETVLQALDINLSFLIIPYQNAGAKHRLD